RCSWPPACCSRTPRPAPIPARTPRSSSNSSEGPDMTAISARLPSERGPGVGLAVVGLGLFGILCGIGVAIGELEALIASLTVLASVAVLADYRIGAVLLVVMLPVSASLLFPHSVFGVIGLNPMNLVLAAT